MRDRFLAICWRSLAACVALAAPAIAQQNGAQAEPETFRAVSPVVLFRTSNLLLLQSRVIQVDLDLTEDQLSRQAALLKQHDEKLRAAGELTDRTKARAAWLAAQEEGEVAARANLNPRQRERLDEIQLQVQGPAALAFDELPRKLQLSQEQIDDIRPLANGARRGAIEATLVPLPPGRDRPATLHDVEELVESREFQSARERAARAVADAWAASLARIEERLADSQRSAYREMLGAPFDLTKLLLSEEPADDVALVAGSLGLTGQRADRDFDVSIAKPAYTDRHPSVLFDEAHHNFHTASGRYKAFADLITNDGYRVTSNQVAFTEQSLSGHDVLVIANATAERTSDGATSAFTAAECDAVRAWVERGGALLLITDHEPFGSASEELGRQFGVDMSKRVAHDPENSNDYILIFAREKNLLGDHPIMRGRNAAERVNRVLTFTGQSLHGPPGSVALLKLADTAVELDGEAEVSAAGRSQGLALSYGKGRAVVLGEAAQLSAQVYGLPPEPMGMNVPGCDNRQMALNIMHWLSGLLN